VSGNAVSIGGGDAGGATVAAGRAAAVVSAGFFAGFAIGPTVGGVLAERAGYGWTWAAVAGAFAVAAVLAVATRRAPDHARRRAGVHVTGSAKPVVAA